MWTELYDITLGAIPAGLKPLALGTPEYEQFSDAFPGHALTSLNVGFHRK